MTLYELALEAFGDADKAARWLAKQDGTPGEIRERLAQIAHGVYV